MPAAAANILHRGPEGATAAVQDITLEGEPFTAEDTGACAAEWLARAEPAVEKKGGRRTTWLTVLRLIRGYMLAADKALDLLVKVYNPRCTPPWSQKDLHAMVERAWRARRRPRPSNENGVVTCADADTLDTAYRMVLDGMHLQPGDEKALRARGLTSAEIVRDGYRSWDTSINRRKAILEKVHEVLSDTMYSVPGIYRTDFGPELGLSVAGLAVPVRDAQGRVTGIRVRIEKIKTNKKGLWLKDRNGDPVIQKSYLWLSGRDDHPEDARVAACCHVPLHAADLDLSEVGITEGEVKANIATLRTGVLYISVPGVGSWRLALDQAKALGAKRIRISYDADSADNRAVAQAIVSTFDAAHDGGVVAAIETWEQASANKGIDDVLVASPTAVQQLEGDDAKSYVDKLANKHELRRKDRETQSPWAPQADVDAALDGAVEAGPPGEWRTLLTYTTGRKPVPKPNPHNVEVFLRHHCEWRGLRVGIDEFRQTLVWMSAPPSSWVDRYHEAAAKVRGSQWTDDDTTNLIATLNREGIDPGRDVVRHVIQSTAAVNNVHPVRDYLNAVEKTWDGRPRLGVVLSGTAGGAWLHDYLGAADNEYVRKVGTWWPVQAVRRIFEPGALAKYILTLEGAQDKGKSTAVEILCGKDWFSDTEMEIGSLNGMLSLSGVWIQEIAEGALLSRHDRKALKGWISKKNDHYTPKWSNVAVTVPRQVVFAMTTNEHCYLTDPTGAVRWWPVPITKVEFEKLAQDRDQIWGEAVHLLKAGMIPEPRSEADKKLLREEVGERQQGDVWETKIAEWLGARSEAAVEEVLTDCFDIVARYQERKDQLRVVDVLTALGWTQAKNRPLRNGRRVRLYLRPGEAPKPRDLTVGEHGAWKALQWQGWKEIIQPDGTRIWVQPTAMPPALNMEEA